MKPARVTGRWWGWPGLAPVAFGALLACSGGSPEARGPTLADGASTTIFASQKALGPHVMEATVLRTVQAEGAPATSSEERLVLQWRDDDNWHLERARDGRTVEAVLVVGGVAHVGAGGPLERRPDAEPYRVLLAQSWDPWALAFEQVDASLELTDEAVEEREGRKAHRHAVRVRPVVEEASPEGGKKRARKRGRPATFTVTAADGTVWIDESTAVRLGAEVRVEASAGVQAHTIELRFALTQIGGEVSLPSPPTVGAAAPLEGARTSDARTRP